MDPVSSTEKHAREGHDSYVCTWELISLEVIAVITVTSGFDIKTRVLGDSN